MKIGKLESKLTVRRRRRKRQSRLWRETGERGHAKAAKRDAKAVRFLQHLLSVEHRRRKRMAPRVMFDDVVVDLIPKNAPSVAGYTGGLYHTLPELEAKFPHTPTMSIAISADEDADCLDVEPGDATPAEAPGWARRQQRLKPHKLPKIYASISQMPEVVLYMKHAGFSRREYLLHSAHYTYEPHVCGPKTCGYPTVCDATQWTDHALGRSLDQSQLTPHYFERG
jgi:hypothetical protein